MNSLIKHIALLAFTVLWLSGCSSNIPDLIKQAPASNIQVKQVQTTPDDLFNSQVRWGGSILGVENQEEATLIEVLSRPLSSKGKPSTSGSSLGRFKIVLPGFIEPKEFPTDRLITVSGRVVEVLEGMVGNYTYHYPLVESDAYHLWAEVKDRYYYPSYYDPFYYPWYPYWYRRPYYWY